MESKSVEVRVMQRQDKTLYIEVSVTSVAFPKSSMQGILEHGEYDNEAQAVGMLAGKMTEELCKRLGDTVSDPGTMARAAIDCYAELCAESPHIFAGNELPRHADKGPTGGVVTH